MDIIKIPYSEKAIKTENGWFAGWGPYGKVNLVDTIELAELLPPVLAEETATTLSDKFEDIKIVNAFIDNEYIAVCWKNRLEVIIDKRAGFEFIASEKSAVNNWIQASRKTRRTMKKYPHLDDWIKNASSPTFTQRVIDEKVVTDYEDMWKHDIRNRIFYNNDLLDINHVFILAGEVIENIERGLEYANNMTWLDIYGNEAVKKSIITKTETSDGTIAPFYLSLDSFVYNTKIHIPQLVFRGLKPTLAIPKPRDPYTDKGLPNI